MPVQSALALLKYYTRAAFDALVTKDTNTIYYVKETNNTISVYVGSEPMNYSAPITGGASTIVSANLTASRALVSNASGKVVVSSVTDTELSYVSGVTSAIQTQLNNKLATSGGTLTGSLTLDSNGSGTTASSYPLTFTGRAANAPFSKSLLMDNTGALKWGGTTLSLVGHTHTYADLTGTVPTWNQDTTGNATTATKLASPVTINGVSFDGSAGITITAAPTAHTHGNISNDGKIGSVPDLVVVTGTNGELTVQSRSGIDSRASFPAAAHAMTLHTATAWRIFYSNSSGALAELALGSAGTYLRSSGASNVPTWSAVQYSELGGTVPTWNQNTTGNAATATKLAASVNINGVAFDGSAGITVYDSTKMPLSGGTFTGNITLNKTTQIGGEANSLSVVFTHQTESADATKALYVNNGGQLVFNSQVVVLNNDSRLSDARTPLAHTHLYSDLTGTVPTWNQSTTGNAATATKLQTARTINGVSFDGSANITITAVPSTASGTVSEVTTGTESALRMWSPSVLKAAILAVSPVANPIFTGIIRSEDNNIIARKITMVEPYGTQYILLCRNAAYNDVNASIRVNRTSGNFQSAHVEIIVTSNSTGIQGGTVFTHQYAQSSEAYDLVTLTYESVSYVALRYVGNEYPYTQAVFSGILTTTETDAAKVLKSVHSGEVTSVTVLPTTTRKLTLDNTALVLTTDTRLSDARTPLSHTHGNITNAGAIGSTADLVVVTGSSGVLTTQSRSGIDSRTAFPPAAHSHAATAINVSGISVIGKSDTGGGTTQELSMTTLKSMLGLGSAAYVATSTFATAVHSHAISDVTGLQTALDNKLSLGGGTLSGQLIVNSNISANRLFQIANGAPTSNLGSPSITEMALFQEQFNNKTEFYDITKIVFETFDGTTWTDVSSSISDSIKRSFVGGDSGTTVNIPNLIIKYRITLRATTYVYLNALYMYWSSQSHSTKVTIWKKHDSSVWEQVTNSTTSISAWPGHMYLPFPTIAWNPTATLGSHWHEVRIEFEPTWSGHPTYGTYPIVLHKMQLWGGYPAGKRTLYSTDENRNANFPASLSATSLVANGTMSLRASALGSTPTHFLILNGDPSSTTRTVQTRTPAQVLADINGLSLNGGNVNGKILSYTSNTTGTYDTRSIELREVGLVTNTQSASNYAPALAFHWGGRVQTQIALLSDGKLVVREDSGNGNAIILNNDSRLSDARTPLSHTHGNISNDGKIGSVPDLVVVTGTNGELTVQSRSGIDSRTSFPAAQHTVASHSATAWRMFYSNATTTAIQELAFGAAGTYLRSSGASAAPTWATIQYSELGGTIPTWNQNTTGNAATATKLAASVNINGVAFDGSASITIYDGSKLPIAGGTLTGNITFSAPAGAAADSRSITFTSRFNSADVVRTLLVNSAGSLVFNSVAVVLTNDSRLSDARTPLAHTHPYSDLTGTVPTWNQNTTGNAATATKLAAAVTIGGVSFDGSANINLPGVNTTGNQNTTGNAATATKLAAAVNINGVSFDGSAAITVYDGTKMPLTGGTFTGNITLDKISATTTSSSRSLVFTARAAGADFTRELLVTTTGALTFNGTAVSLVGHTHTYSDLTGTVPTWNQSTTGNAATATKLASPVTINGVSFDGSANITITATDASKLPLTGGTLTGDLTMDKVSASVSSDSRAIIFRARAASTDFTRTLRVASTGRLVFYDGIADRAVYHEGYLPTIMASASSTIDISGANIEIGTDNDVNIYGQGLFFNDTAVSLQGHTHSISDVTGLQTALDAKQQKIVSKRLSSNQTVTGAVLTDATGMSLALSGGRLYKIEIIGSYSSSTTASGMTLQGVFSGSSTGMGQSQTALSGTSSTATAEHLSFAGANVSWISAGSVAATGTSVSFVVHAVLNVTNSGTFKIQFAARTGSQTQITLNAGTTLIVTDITQ